MSKKNSVMDKMNPTKDQGDQPVFDKINYYIMIAGIGLIILGFSIMMMETGEYGFGFLGLTLGPVVVVLGFAVEFAAILYKTKKDGSN
jgi:hypothetical protein